MFLRPLPGYSVHSDRHAVGVKPYIDEVLLVYLYKHSRNKNLLTLI
jgi:hypothetical protein